MQDWKRTDRNAGLENAGLENDGQKSAAGKTEGFALYHTIVQVQLITSLSR